MSSDVVFTAVKDFLTANFTTYPVTYENQAFVRPVLQTPWVIVLIDGSLFQQASIGSGFSPLEKWREGGTVELHVMTKSGSGSLLGRQIATVLANMFRGLTLPPDIKFDDLSIGGGMAQIDDGNWWPLTVTAHYLRDTA